MLLDEWEAELADKEVKAQLLRLTGRLTSPENLALRIAKLIAGLLGSPVPDDGARNRWQAMIDASILEIENHRAPVWVLLDNDGTGRDGGALDEVLTYILEILPENLFIALAGRRYPKIPLSRLRVSHRLLLLGSHDLSFDADEMERFLRQETRSPIDPFDRDKLMALTQGWPAGNRFVALDMQKAPRYKDALASFAEFPQDLVSFFDECVAADLSTDMLFGLTRTVILNEIDLPSCTSILGEARATEIITRLAEGDLFATCIEPGHLRYRFHPLFRRYLQRRLESLPLDEVADLHRDASFGCEARADWAGAVHHAFACGDNLRAIDLAERCASDEVSKGNLANVLEWIARIPSKELARRQLLLAASGTGFALSLRLDEARAVSNSLAEALRDAPFSRDAEALALRHRVLQIFIAYMSDDGEALLALACEPVLPGVDKWLDVVVSNALIHGNLIAGSVAKARASALPKLESTRREWALFATVCQTCLLGLCDIAENRFDTAREHFGFAFERAESDGGPDSVPAALAASFLAMIAFEQGDLVLADTLLAGRLDTMEYTAFVEGQIACHLTLARLNGVKRNWNAANIVLDRGIKLGRRRGWLRLEGACLLEKLRVALCQNQSSTARALAVSLRTLVSSTDFTTRTPVSYVAQLASLGDGWLLLESGKSAAAAAHFNRLNRLHLWDDYLALQVRVAHAAAIHAAGRRGPAIEAMITLIEFAAARGLHRSLVDTVPQTGTVVLAAVAVLLENDDERVDPMFLRALSEAVRTALADGVVSVAMNDLTQRECDLVRLIRHGMTNKEIAQTLDIGVETVKWHLKGIFRKLGVRNRTEVVSRMFQQRPDDTLL